MNMGARMQAHSWHGLPSDLVANAEPSGIPPMSSSLLVFFFSCFLFAYLQPADSSSSLTRLHPRYHPRPLRDPQVLDDESAHRSLTYAYLTYAPLKEKASKMSSHFGQPATSHQPLEFSI